MRRRTRATSRPAGVRFVPPGRLAEIAELAEAVAAAAGGAGLVDPEAIARARRITLSYNQYGLAFDGLLECRQGRFHIFCNLDRVGRRGSPRARFTLAHELGHYFLDAHRNALADGRAPAHPSQCDYESADLVEQEADHFAANLLMPASRFAAKARSSRRGLAAILALAEAFGTSVTATAIRYAAADAAPCAVVKWTAGRYGWKRLSSATFLARYRRTIEAPGEVAEGSPTWRALAGDAPPETGYFEAGTAAAAWFPRVPAGHQRDIILVEQAIPLGRYGALTLLVPEGGRY